jgi:hypothetical protein
MNREWAIRAVWVLAILFVVGMIDLFSDWLRVIPEPITKICEAILIGVAIGAIVRGLAVANGARNHGGGEDEGGDKDDG